MTHVIVYDIQDDNVRNRIAKLLLNHGQRVQESVFECELSKAELGPLSRKLQQALEGSNSGNIRLYRVCAQCLGGSFGLGELVRGFDSEPCILV